MPPPQRHSSQNQLANRMPRAAERVILTGEPDADPDAAVGRDGLEDDVEGGVGDGVVLEVGRFGDGDEEDCYRNPPDVVA